MNHRAGKLVALHPLQRRCQKGDLAVIEHLVLPFLARDNSGSSSTLLYNPRMRTNGASSVKYTPGWIIVVRTRLPASDDCAAVAVQKFFRNASSVGAGSFGYTMPS